MKVPLGFSAMLLGMISANAHAANPADAWAVCAWEKLPVSSHNYIRIGAGEQTALRPSSNPSATPENVLRLRLDDACGELLPRNVLTSIFESAKRTRIAALEARKPTNVATREKNPRLFICEHGLEGQIFFTELGVKKKSRSRGNVEVKCFVTSSDGSLIDA